MNRKGDVDRYMIWFIVLLIVVLIVISLFYLSAINITRGIGP
ncbi:MAG: hypothetical protein QXY45_00240 [Candidatus Aenigmatarchaeota archaeon]